MSASRPEEDYRFDLLEPLGSGTLGERFRAVEMATGDEVVFTRLHRHWTRGWPSEEPFLRTVERMRAVRSLSVATTLAGGVDGEGWWLTTEDARGTRLDRLIPDGGPMPERQVLRLAHQMAAGLAVLHRHSLPHGALEPGAVLLTEEGRVVLTEHGLLPLLVRGAARFGNLPAGHTLRGDPAYMSPEVVSDGGAGVPGTTSTRSASCCCTRRRATALTETSTCWPPRRGCCATCRPSRRGCPPGPAS